MAASRPRSSEVVSALERIVAKCWIEGDLLDHLHRSRRRARREREARIARLGVTLNEEVEEEIAGFTEEVHIRSVKLENDADRMDEEQHESEHEMAVDEEVDTDSAERAMNWALLEESPTRQDGAEADVQSAGAGYDYEDPEEVQEDGEESESCASTEHGSLQFIQEDFEAFEDLTTLPMTSTGGSCFSMREEWSTMWSRSQAVGMASEVGY